MRIILHIGQHKTGSKALQAALYANRRYLAEQSVAYPVPVVSTRPLRPWEMNHHRLFTAVRAAARSEAAAASLQEHLQRLLGECDPATRTIVLSAEDLFDMHTAHETTFSPELVAAGSSVLARALAEHTDQVTVACYLRRQDHLLAAHYAQLIKGSHAHHPTFAEFHAGFAPRLDAAAILAHWEAAFGQAAVNVAPYKPAAMPGGIVTDFCARVLMIDPPPVAVPYPDDLEAFNVTPSRDHIEFMRCLNRRSSRGRPVLPRAQVLEAAFRYRSEGHQGVAAWLSPRERSDLLGRYETGNRGIAARHGYETGLFREPAPNPDDHWEPPRIPGLSRLIELDSQARDRACRRSVARHDGRRWRFRRVTRLAVWVMTPQATAADDELAARLYGGIAGRPDLESTLLPRLRLGGVLRRPRPIALVVLVGPVLENDRDAMRLRVLRWAGARVVQVLGRVPATEAGIEAVRAAARIIDVIACSDEHLLADVLHIMPALHAVPGHPAGGTMLPEMLLDDLVAA